MPNTAYLTTMTEHYLIAAEWTARDENGEERVHAAPGKFFSHLGEFVPSATRDPETVRVARDTCADFLTSAWPYLGTWTAEQAGHDFWLTRNGHGAGFWDRGAGEAGERLSDLARPYGEAYEYVDSTTNTLFIDG